MLQISLSSFSLFSFDVILKREDWDDHADENCADEPGDKEKHERFRHGDGRFELSIQIAFRDICDTNEFLIEAPAFLGDGNHFPYRARKQSATIRQAGTKLLSFFDALD